MSETRFTMWLQHIAAILTIKWNLAYQEFLQFLLSKTVYPQSQKSKMQFNLIFCTELSKFSKHLEFLSFKIVHQILAGITLHLSISFVKVLLPPNSQRFQKSCMALSKRCLLRKLIRSTKILHDCSISLQWRKRRLSLLFHHSRRWQYHMQGITSIMLA